MALTGGGSTPGADWQAGMNLLSAGKAGEAIAALQSFLQTNPESFEGNNFLGVALSQVGRHEEAIIALQKATRLNAQSAPARFNLGVAFEKMNRVEAARKEYQAAIQLDPKHTAASLALAKLDAGVGSTPLANSSMATQAANESNPWASGTASTQQLGAAQIAEQKLHAKPNVLNILGALALGFVAAIVCAILWDKLTYYSGWQFGYAAIGVGFLVGLAVVMGAGGKHGISLQVIAGLLSLFGIVLGQTLLVTDYVRDEIAKAPTPGNAGASGLDIFFLSATLLPDYYKESPMSALFALMGLWCGWSAPAKPKEEEFPEATATDAPPPAGSTPGRAVVDAPAPAANNPLSTPDAGAPLDGPPHA